MDNHINMNIEVNELISIIGIIATIIVGGVLYRVIDSQKTVIEGMKSYMGIFDIDRVKSYAKLTEEEVELKYSKRMREEMEKIKAELNSTDKAAKAKAIKSYIDHNIELIDRFEEITSNIVNFALTMKPDERDKFLSNFPKNKEILMAFITAIERKEVRPGKSTDSKTSA